MTYSTETLIGRGVLCAKCHVEFDGQHGSAVYCHTCYDEIKAKGLQPTLPKAWLEEKSK